MVLVVMGEGTCCLVVRKEGGGGCDRSEGVGDKAAKPQHFLYAIQYVAVTYSLLVVERETISWCLENQETAPPSVRKV